MEPLEGDDGCVVEASWLKLLCEVDVVGEVVYEIGVLGSLCF